jgi:hypothetical protein
MLSREGIASKARDRILLGGSGVWEGPLFSVSNQEKVLKASGANGEGYIQKISKPIRSKADQISRRSLFGDE